MDVKNMISKAKTNFKTRVAPAVISAGTAISAVAISASAESGSTVSIDYKSIGQTFIQGFNDVISGCIDVAVAVIPLGLGLYGIGLVWNTAKKFFTKATN